jgi:phosphopantothenate---cysteine ligase (CTP)
MRVTVGSPAPTPHSSDTRSMSSLLPPSLSGRHILVTAGPTWCPIDAVRHLANLSSGGTGLAIARALAAAGAKTTLLLGPGRVLPTDADRTTLRILDFVTFDDLHAAVREQVGTRGYDALVHSAAVSDYRLAEEYSGKLSSDAEELVLRLVRTPKIVDEVKGLDPEILLVKFKLEVGRTEAELLEIGARSRERSQAELLVANDLTGKTGALHAAYLLDANGVVERVETTAALAELLTRVLAERLCKTPRPRRTLLPMRRLGREERAGRGRMRTS